MSKRAQAKHTRDDLAALRRYAWLLDSSIPLPFGRSIGVDGLIGLIPGLGDAAGGLLSSLIVFRAWRMGAAPSVLLRMLGNIALEAAVGIVPVVGDLFDIAFKANRRNVALLEQWAAARERTGHRSRIVVAATAVLLLAILAAGCVLLFWLASLIVDRLFA